MADSHPTKAALTEEGKLFIKNVVKQTLSRKSLPEQSGNVVADVHQYNRDEVEESDEEAALKVFQETGRTAHLLENAFQKEIKKIDERILMRRSCSPYTRRRRPVAVDDRDRESYLYHAERKYHDYKRKHFPDKWSNDRYFEHRSLRNPCGRGPYTNEKGRRFSDDSQSDIDICAPESHDKKHKKHKSKSKSKSKSNKKHKKRKKDKYGHKHHSNGTSSKQKDTTSESSSDYSIDTSDMSITETESDDDVFKSGKKKKRRRIGDIMKKIKKKHSKSTSRKVKEHKHKKKRKR